MSDLPTSHFILKRPFVLACGYILVADVILGTMRPMLSRFADILGANLAVIGVLGLVVGLSQVSTSVLVGAISDRLGRKIVLTSGMVLLGITAVMIGMSKTTSVLISTQIVLGLGFSASITTAIVYIADLVPKSSRGLAFGIGTTMMGLGYSLGSLLGGVVAQYWGYRSVYFVAALLSVIGFVIALMCLDYMPENDGSRTSTLSSLRFIRTIFSDNMVLTISLGGLLVFMVFGGLVVMFFPIYAISVGLSPATIGALFAMRTIASTLARLPGGFLARRKAGGWLLPIALFGTGVFAFGVPQVSEPMMIALFLLIEGVSYGLYLTVGQLFIVNASDEGYRGVVLGSYATITAVGAGVIPFFLGIAADSAGLENMFRVTGMAVCAGAGIMLLMTIRYGVPKLVSGT